MTTLPMTGRPPAPFEPPVAPTARDSRVDAWLSGVLAAVFAAMALAAWAYPPPARTLPLGVGIVGATLSLAEFARRVGAARRRPEGAGPLRPRLVLVGWFAAAAASVVVLGVATGSAVFVAAYLWKRERRRAATAIATAALTAAILLLVFERMLGLYLYAGVVWP